MTDANFSELVNTAYGNVTDGALSFSETTVTEGENLGAIIVVIFIFLMIVLVLTFIIAGLFKIIKG